MCTTEHHHLPPGVSHGGRDIITTAAVSNTQHTSVSLGWDVHVLMTYIAEHEESRLINFSLFGPYFCHTKSYDHKIHIKMIY